MNIFFFLTIYLLNKIIYEKMNKLLPITFKIFLKNSATTPFLIEKNFLENLPLKLKKFEFCQATIVSTGIFIKKDSKFKVCLMLCLY